MSLDRKINRIQFLSGNSLKVIAVLTMLIDHLCKIVLQVSAGVFRAFKIPGRKASSRVVTRREKTTATQNDVEIKLSVFSLSFAPIA